MAQANIMDRLKASFLDAGNVLQAFLSQEKNLTTMQEIVNLMAQTFYNNGKVIIFGNGGSMCDAMHFAEELTGRFRNDRKPLPAIALSDPAHITCVGNDYGFEEIFSRGVEAYAQSQDMVIGISTSGNSQNIIKALQTAQSINCFTVALLGKDGGKLKDTCDYELIVPGETSDRIQEVHIKILHILIEMLEYIMFS